MSKQVLQRIYISNLTAQKVEGYSLLKAAKDLKRPTQKIPPIKQENGKWVHSAQDNADLFAKRLGNTFQPLGILASDNRKWPKLLWSQITIDDLSHLV